MQTLTDPSRTSRVYGDMYKMHTLYVGFAVLLTFSALSPSRAAACSPLCEDSVRLFLTDAVPGNLVRFKLRADHAGPLTLKTADGAVIPASIRTLGRDRVFAPDQPIAEGTQVELTFRSRCGVDRTATFRFTALAHAKLSLRPAELEIIAQGMAYPGSPRNEAAFFQVRHYGPDAQASALHLIDSFASIDGKPTWLSEVDGSPAVEVKSYCSEAWSKEGIDTCGRIHSVAPGEHIIEVASTIVGEPTPPPVRTKVTLHCDKACPPSSNTATPKAEQTKHAHAITREPSSAACATRGATQTPNTGILLASCVLATNVIRKRRGAA